MKTWAFSAGMCILGVTAATQAIRGVVRERTPAQAGPYVSAKPGQSVDVLVRRAGSVAPLSRVAAGSCRLIVILSPTCSPSLEAVGHWRAAQRDAAGAPELPAEWQVIWVASGDTASALKAFPSLAGKLWTAAQPGSIERSVGLRAYPAHVVLDRSGRIVSGDVGARLLPRTAYHEDCSVSEEGRGQ
jgi:hypothetical protein